MNPPNEKEFKAALDLAVEMEKQLYEMRKEKEVWRKRAEHEKQGCDAEYGERSWESIDKDIEEWAEENL